MPTYEYKCEACGNRWEKFQSITAAPIRKCPKCGKSKARRLIGTGAGLIFKGSGFYITDYRDASYNEKAKAESGSTTPPDAKTETKSDSKSEAKSDAKSEPKSEAKSSSDTKAKTPPKHEKGGGKKR